MKQVIGKNGEKITVDQEVREMADIILQVAQASIDSQVNIAGSHLTTVNLNETTVSSTYYGDPTKVSTGIELTKHKETTVSDVYIVFLNKVVQILGFSAFGSETVDSNGNTAVAVTSFEDTANSFDFDELLAIPNYTITTTTSPVYVVLNTDASFGDPGDPSPSKRVYNLIQNARDAEEIVKHLIVMRFFLDYTVEGISAYCILAGIAGENAYTKKMAQINDPISSEFFNIINSVRRYTSFYDKVRDILVSRLHAGFGYQEYVWVTGRDTTGSFAAGIAASAAISNCLSLYKLMKKKIQDMITPDEYGNTEAGFKYRITNTRTMLYKIHGTVTNKEAASYTLAQNGTVTVHSVQTQTVLTESVLRQFSPIKRNLRWPTTHSGVEIIQTGMAYTNISLPTSNWDDVQNVFNLAPRIISQNMDSFTFETSDYSECVALFESYAMLMGTKSVRLNYSFTTGQGTIAINWVSGA